MNLLSDDDSEPNLTQQVYELYLGSVQLIDEENVNNFDEPTSQYKILTDSILVELQDKYDLRPREKIVVINKPKKVLLRKKENEVVFLKPSIETSIVQTKQVEEKTTQTKTLENKESEVQTKEIEKPFSTFNLGNELNKIKIPVPLIELAKNPSYKKQISKS
jgi:hypothetical protein